MKIRWLVLALLVSMSGAASAQNTAMDANNTATDANTAGMDANHPDANHTVMDANNQDTTINRDRMWNPFLGTKPWLQPLGYRVVRGPAHDANGRNVDHDNIYPTSGTQSIWENCNDQNHHLHNHDAHPGAHMH